MKRWALWAALAATMPGCALIDSGLGKVGMSSGGMAEAAKREAAETARAAVAASPEVVKRCYDAATLPVPFDEEKEMGGAVALALGAKYGHVMVETSASLQGLSKDGLATMKGKEATPGKGPLTNFELYLNRVGKALAAGSTRPTLPWTFMVLDSPAANAFSAPGGYVFVTRGLLATLKNEDQLAGVLAHEIIHVTRKHALNSYQTAKGWACGASGIVSAGGKDAQGIPGVKELVAALGGKDFNPAKLTKDAIVTLTEKAAEKYQEVGVGPQQEYESDLDAISLLTVAGYNPKEFATVLNDTPKAAFLSPHPDGADRSKRVLAFVDKAAKDSEFGGSADLNAKAVPFPSEYEVIKK